MLYLKKHIQLKTFLFLVQSIIIAFISFSEVKAQNEFYNFGSAIDVQAGALIYVQGEVINTNNGANVGLISNSGTITLSGDWTNNSTSSALVATTGLVELNGALQLIKGTQPTTFNNLTLLGTNIKRLNVNTFVGGTNGVLNLTARTFDLNSKTLFVTNSLPTAFARTSGFVLSETTAIPGYGTIQWNVANNAGNYEFPFGTNASNYIPLFQNITTSGVQSGTGNISASTYPTITSVALNNRPLPTGVNDLLNNCNTDHAIKMLDRFWVINANNYSTKPSAIKKLTYVDDEWNTLAGSTNLITETDLNTWHYGTTAWAKINSTNNATTNEQTAVANTTYGLFTLGEYKELQLTLLNVDSVICFGESNGVIQFSVTATGYQPNSFTWNSVAFTNTISTNLAAGNYTIVATDVMNCKETLNDIPVFQPTKLTHTLTSNDLSICKNQTISLTSNYGGGTKPYVLNWSTGALNSNLTNTSTSLINSPALTTTFTTILTDRNNCTLTQSLSVNVNQLPNLDFDSNPKSGCQALFVSFINLSTNTPTITSYEWNFSSGVKSTLFAPDIIFFNPTKYSVSLSAVSDSGCVNKITKTDFIEVYPKPIAEFTFQPDENIDLSNSDIQFQNNSLGNYNSSSWTFADGQFSSETNPLHKYEDIGAFNVRLIVSNSFGCVDSITKGVIVDEVPAIFIPNAFTPTKPEGLNDIFTVKGINFNEFDMMIFDRWGEKILHTNDPITGWDGKFKNKPCEPGVYVYKISFKFMNSLGKRQEKIVVGHVTLL